MTQPTKPSLSMLLHAPSKQGKTTLSSTAPLPMCVFDAEGGWRFIKQAGFQSGVPLRVIEWDPVRQAPPQHDGSWDVARVPVFKWETLTNGYTHLAQSQHQFRTVTLDSVTESQRKLKANLRGTEQMRIQDWGDLLVYMDKLIRDMRDLVLIPTNPLQFALFIAETEFKNGKWCPAMQGQIGRSLPYWVDVCGYLFQDKVLGADGQPTRKRVNLLVAGDSNFEVGERVQGALPDLIQDPNIRQILNTIFAPAKASEEGTK